MEGLGITVPDLLASTDLLQAILLYHVVPVEVLDADLIDGQVLPTLLEGQTITVSLREGRVFLQPTGGPEVEDIVDILADNGVVHVISGVLVPALAAAPEAEVLPPASEGILEILVPAFEG